jgi:tetratricopeptide (TPR) repeat protein
MTTPPVEVEVAPGRVERLAAVGASFWGSVHRGEDPPSLYRLVPVAKVPVEGRNEIGRWAGGRTRPAVAPIAEARQLVDGGWYAIRYHLRAERTLAELPPETSPSDRLELAVRVLGAFGDWMDALGSGLLPMPADIALTAAGTPYLLPMPYRWAPDPGAVLEEPDRARYLAPEVVRGRPAGPAEAADRYALGATVLGLFAQPQPDDPAELLLQAATATALEPRRLRGLLPSWLQELPVTERLLTGVGELLKTDPEARCRPDPGRIAEELLELRPWTVPAEAVRKLEVEGRRDDAWVLLLEALGAGGDYDLLLAGGRLAMKDPRRHEAAVRLFERAIELAPERPDAYRWQLELLADGAGGDDVAGSLLRDFARLPAHRQDAFEVAVARRLLEVGGPRRAAEFIYRRLYRDRDYLWWKLELNLCYAEALLGLRDREAEVRRQLDRVEEGLDKVERGRTMAPGELRSNRAWARRLRARLTDPPAGSP